MYDTTEPSPMDYVKEGTRESQLERLDKVAYYQRELIAQLSSKLAMVSERAVPSAPVVGSNVAEQPHLRDMVNRIEQNNQQLDAIINSLVI